MRTKIKIGEKLYQIEIIEMKEGLINVKVNEKDFLFGKNEFDELILLEGKAREAVILDKEERFFREILTEKEIKSPIAGLVASLEVRKGDFLKSGQKVATLIAMKMENEIISETAGKVQEIKVKAGQFVNGGEVLIILE